MYCTRVHVLEARVEALHSLASETVTITSIPHTILAKSPRSVHPARAEKVAGSGAGFGYALICYGNNNLYPPSSVTIAAVVSSGLTKRLYIDRQAITSFGFGNRRSVRIVCRYLTRLLDYGVVQADS